MSVVPLGPLGRDPHAELQALLPWYLRGRLDEAEQQRLHDHLQGCARCREELALERRLQQALPPQPVAPHNEVEAALARLRPRLGRPQAARPSWWGWLVGGQGGAILVLLVLLARAPGPADESFRALADPALPAAAQALVMFRPEASEVQIRSALQVGGARLIGGPTAGGAYLLRLDSAEPAAALARLRAQPGVLMAESLERSGK